MDPYLSEIRLMCFDFAPAGWATCDGQLLQIDQNPELFKLIGTTYGGDGVTTFAVPDLRVRVPLHIGNGFDLGQRGGEQGHVLTLDELPAHTHDVQASGLVANENIPGGSVVLATAALNAYRNPADEPLVPLDPDIIGETGGSHPHPNMQPLLTLNFCISLTGTVPAAG